MNVEKEKWRLWYVFVEVACEQDGVEDVYVSVTVQVSVGVPVPAFGVCAEGVCQLNGVEDVNKAVVGDVTWQSFDYHGAVSNDVVTWVSVISVAISRPYLDTYLPWDTSGVAVYRPRIRSIPPQRHCRRLVWH